MENSISMGPSLWDLLKQYSLQLPFLVLILYAIWHLLMTRIVVSRFYKKIGFTQVLATQRSGLLNSRESILMMSLSGWDAKRSAPVSAYQGRYEGYEVQQFVAKRRRGSNLIRKKTSYRTQYTVTIVKSPVALVELCARPKMVIDAVDYVFDGHDIGIPGEDEFSRLYHVRGLSTEQVQRCLGEPLRELLLQVEGISIETIADHLIFLRVRDYFEIEGNLETELDSAIQITRYLGKVSEGSRAQSQ